MDFHQFIMNLRKEQDFTMDQTGNTNETSMSFNMLGNRIIDKVCTKSVYVRTTGHEKTHFTGVLCWLANCEKLSPIVVLNCKTIPKSEKFPPGVVVH